jgi:hypothetical protein
MSIALMTGTMIYFMKDGRPHYEYEPIRCTRSQSEAWFDDAMERNQAHMWMKTIHWRLEKMSCVLVLRNKLWFQHAIKVLDDLWKTILHERANPHGCEHRAPKRRIAPSPTAPNATAAPATSKSASFMQAWLSTSQPVSTENKPANANPNAVYERKCLIDMSSLE